MFQEIGSIFLSSEILWRRSRRVKARKVGAGAVRRKRCGFPGGKAVSLNLAKCAKSSLLTMLTRIEMSQKNSRKEKTETSDGLSCYNLKFDDKDSMPSTSNVLTTETFSALAKKKAKKKAIKRQGMLFRRVGKKFIRTFVYFSKTGGTTRCNSISYPKTLRWLKRAKIVDNHRVTIRDVEVHFINELKVGYELKILHFIRFLKSLCEERGLHMSAVLLKLMECSRNKTIISNIKTRLYNGKVIRGYTLKPAHKKKVKFPFTKVKKNKDLKNGKIKSENEVNDANSRELLQLKTGNSIKGKTSAVIRESNSSNFKKSPPVWLNPFLKALPPESGKFVQNESPQQILLEKTSNKMSNITNSKQKVAKIQPLKEKNKDKDIRLNTKLPLIHADVSCFFGLNKDILKINGNEDNYEYIPSETSLRNPILSRNMKDDVHYGKERDLEGSAKKTSALKPGNRKENIVQTEKNKKLKKRVKDRKTLDFHRIYNSSMEDDVREIVYIESIAVEENKGENYDKEHRHRNEKLPISNQITNKKLSKSIYSIVDEKTKINKNSIGSTCPNTKNETEYKPETSKAEAKNITLNAKKRLSRSISKIPSGSTKNKHTLPKLKEAPPHKNLSAKKSPTTQTEKSVTIRRKIKNPRTFTNLAVSKVQKALSDSRKQKMKNALNSKPDSYSKTLGAKSNAKVRSKNRKLHGTTNKEQESA